jgi:uncharacterized protein YuzE
MTAQTIHYDYDEDVDILYIAFAPGEKATAAVELNDNILLRFDRTARRAIGITLMDFSVLVQPSELGPRHFPLSGLANLEPDWRELVIDLLTSPPVNQILNVASFTPSAAETMPIVSIENPLAPASL